MIQIIICGGQTGADRPTLDWAIAKDIQRGGIAQFFHEVMDEMLANSFAKKRVYDIEPKITIK